MRYTLIGLVWVSCVLVATQVRAAGVADLQITVTRPGAIIKVDRVVAEGKLVVSVEDTQKQPLLGLLKDDFATRQLAAAAIGQASRRLTAIFVCLFN